MKNIELLTKAKSLGGDHRMKGKDPRVLTLGPSTRPDEGYAEGGTRGLPWRLEPAAHTSGLVLFPTSIASGTEEEFLPPIS